MCLKSIEIFLQRGLWVQNQCMHVHVVHIKIWLIYSKDTLVTVLKFNVVSFLLRCSAKFMFRLQVCPETRFWREHLPANFTRIFSLVIRLFRSLCCRFTTVHLPLVSVHVMLLSETFFAEFAREPPIFIRVNSLGSLQESKRNSD